MKLLFVIDNLRTGGAQRQLVTLAVGLQQRGHSVEVFCYAPGELLAPPLYEMRIPIRQHFKSSRFSSDVVSSLRNLIKKGQYGLALSFLTTPNLYTILAGKIFNLPRLPVVISERFCDLQQEMTFMERLPRYLYNLADHIVVNSQHQRINFENKYPRLKGRISTIYNGYDLEKFSPTLIESNNPTLKLLTIASVSRYKNGLCLIEALHVLRYLYGLLPTVSWIGRKDMAGHRLAYLREMERMIREYHLESQWQWLGERSDIVQQLQQHDVLVHPSYGEGLPNAVCEAMACARPVIISNTLDHPMLIKDGQSGYLFDWQDPRDLAQKIKIFSDLSLTQRKEMGLRGRRYAEQNLSIDRYVADYECLFSKISNGPQSH
jgi:glycosyltransferase involved in cell wall biosynthesis